MEAKKDFPNIDTLDMNENVMKMIKFSLEMTSDSIAKVQEFNSKIINDMINIVNTGNMPGGNDMELNIGDRVELKGFPPMTVDDYEGSHGIIVDIRESPLLGDMVFVQLTDCTDSRIIQTKRRFCKKETC